MSTDTLILGRQTFDGLGRQRSVQVAGRSTQYHYRAGQLPPSANTLADGKRVTFTYEPQLGNALLTSHADGATQQRLDYHPTLGLPCSASGEPGSQHWSFDSAGLPLRDAWQVDGEEHSTQWRYSFNGQLLGFTDSGAVEHQRHHDGYGRLSVLKVGEVTTTFAYDVFSRLDTVTTQDPVADRRLTRKITYDSMGREHRNSFTVVNDGNTRTFTQTLAYSGLDQLTSRTWHDGEQQGEETFAYDLRGRMVRYQADLHAAPQDPFGNRVVEQRFSFNALDGHTQVVTTFADGTRDEARFSYAKNDPTQVVSITHTHPSWPERITLTYDACGRLIADSLGRQLNWDAHERLARVQLDGRTCEYRYDASGHLCDRVLDGQLERSFFSADQLTHAQPSGQRHSLVGDGASLFAINHPGANTTLLGCDGQGSVRLEVDDDVRQRRYTAHGSGPNDSAGSWFGFTGERQEPLTSWLIPGGYRPYDPLLMMFLAPDSESPFGRGGINAYAYRGGDPVNRFDPDGHSWMNWTLAGIGLVIGAAATLASLGTAAPAVATVLAGGLGALSANSALAISTAALSAVSLGTGVASVALQASDADSKAASVLGWISLGTGIASAVTGMAPAAAKWAAGLSNSSGRAASKLANFKPYRVGPGGGQRPATVLFGTTKDGSDVAFIPNLYGENTAAFMTHGHPLGMLMNAQGQADDAANIARNLIAPRLAEMGYPAEQKIVLLTCWGGKSGAAQKIANELRRPVEAYSQKLFLRGAAALQMPRTYEPLWNTGFNNIPVYMPSLASRAWRRLNGHFPAFADKPYSIAKSKLYHPG
ncbi:RHS repeat domain-containing protein [Pseudomonas sp. GZD-209]|uniref:RHS repeat domain-containing protein n=1 Tax=Pseudomonas sp. GZD-209 TaxID=3404807 RepID=UPI003BB4D387